MRTAISSPWAVEATPRRSADPPGTLWLSRTLWFSTFMCEGAAPCDGLRNRPRHLQRRRNDNEYDAAQRLPDSLCREWFLPGPCRQSHSTADRRRAGLYPHLRGG